MFGLVDRLERRRSLVQTPPKGAKMSARFVRLGTQNYSVNTNKHCNFQLVCSAHRVKTKLRVTLLIFSENHEIRDHYSERSGYYSQYKFIGLFKFLVSKDNIISSR